MSRIRKNGKTDLARKLKDMTNMNRKKKGNKCYKNTRNKYK